MPKGTFLDRGSMKHIGTYGSVPIKCIGGTALEVGSKPKQLDRKEARKRKKEQRQRKKI